ncbi:ester cyclase [Flavobacterium aquidurense]|uniref:ester cyclase n=1 Tax=Flavobacterium aquidurense TaxID=362413 RepID=UPI00371BAD94
MKNNTAENKQLVRNFYESIEKEDYNTTAKYCHEDFTFYLQVDHPIKGADGFVKSEKKNFDAFKGFTFRIQELICEGDKVAAYLIFDGKHTSANILNVEPTGNRVRFSLFMLLTIKDGKIIEKRAHFDHQDVKAQVMR